MIVFNPKDFIDTLMSKKTNDTIACPFCGGKKFTSTEYAASVIIGKDTKTVAIGPTLPAGMLICENCGHIDFFALGALGLLDNSERDK